MSSEKARLESAERSVPGAGGSTDQKVSEYVGADDFGASAVDGVEKISEAKFVA